MKRIVSFILMTIMLSYSFNQVGVFIEYIADIEAYTDKYCENKDEPESLCHGSCHFTQELAKKEKEHEKQDVQLLPKIIVLNTFEKVQIENHHLITIEEKDFFSEPNFSEKELYYSIFYPPKSVS